MKLISTKALGLALAAAISLSMAGVADAASGRITIESGGVRRSAFIVEHARLKRTRRPTIIVLHGQAGNGLRVRRYLGLESALKSRSVVTVYPDALGGHWDVGAANGERDLKFIHDLIAKLESEGISDRRRIYVVGSATGGILAMRMACRETQAVAGVAALISLMPQADAAACKPSRPLPFLLLVGTADARLPYAGGKADLVEYKGEVASAEATLAPFAAAAGCGPKRTRVDLPDRDKTDGSRVQLELPGGCKAPIELVRIEGGGHTLPGHGRPIQQGRAVGARNNDIDAARIVVEFFRRARGG